MNVILRNNKEELDELIANEFIKLIKENPNCVLGLATGSSPLGVYKRLVEAYQKGEISFKNVKTFNLDEYVGYKEEKDSYRYFMNENLFNHIDIDKNNTHFPSEELLEKYDDLIEQAGGIDLQILGIGSDGHIAFNEPGTEFTSKTHIQKLDPQTIQDNARFFKSIDDVPTSAVTMGLATIIKAKKIVLIATGSNKRNAVMELFSGISKSCPASVLNIHDDASIYFDKDALVNKVN